jgi:hypothetical protein
MAVLPALHPIIVSNRRREIDLSGSWLMAIPLIFIVARSINDTGGIRRV